jgi:sec-independent protein translocase protein TatC
MANEPEELPTDHEDEYGGPVKSFLDHLEDVRWVIIKSSATLAVAMIGCFVGAPQVIAFLTMPLRVTGLPINLEFFGPLGGFTISMKAAFYAGMVIALPFILYFLGQFIIPALKLKERQFLLRIFTIGTGFFLLGVVVCYFWIAPLSIKGLYAYNQWLGIQSTIWRAEEYFEFINKFMLGVGLIFEVPVLILTLVRVGLIKYQTLKKARGYMFIANLVLCCVMTPADLVTTMMMTLVLQLMFEGCLLIARFWEHQRIKAEKETALLEK